MERVAARNSRLRQKGHGLHKALGFGFWVLASLWLLLPGGVARAAEFTAETTLMRYGKPQQVKVYVKGSWIREELKDIFGQPQVLISTGSGEGQTAVLYPANKIYMRLPAAAALPPVGESEEALKGIGTRRLLGQEMVNGYLCDKYEIVFFNEYRGKALQWIARRLHHTIRLVPVNAPPGAPQRDLRNIREQPLADTLFQVPPDYRMVKKPTQGFCGAGFCTVNFY